MGFPKKVVPPNGWFIMEKSIYKWMIGGYPHFRFNLLMYKDVYGFVGLSHSGLVPNVAYMSLD